MQRKYLNFHHIYPMLLWVHSIIGIYIIGAETIISNLKGNPIKVLTHQTLDNGKFFKDQT